MVVEEQHRRDDHVALGDVGYAAIERARVMVPVGGGVEADGDVGAVPGEPRRGTLGGARQMIVERDDHDVQGGPLTGHNVPSRRRACRA